MGRVNIELEEELHKRLKVACVLKKKTIQEMINEALSERLKREKDVK